MARSDARPIADGAALYERLRPRVRWNLSVEALVEEAVRHGEGVLTRAGALAVRTGKYTGRSPRDKYVVRREPSASRIDWSSRFNLPIEPERAEALFARFAAHAEGLPRLYGFRGWVGRGRHRLPIALITETAWHSLMGRHLFVRPTAEELAASRPEFTLLYLPSLRADPARDGVRSEVAILCDLERGLGAIGGTAYGGEEKKFFFYVMNDRLPLEGAFPMHCSANRGRAGDVTLIFGLSGTGKTTLSTDPERTLIGDDEHGWDAEGVFNLEGGCYAKLLRLSREREPLIWDAVNRPGSILENVPVRDGEPDFEEATIENTRGVYPLEALPVADPSGRGGHPTTIAFLTFDASGVLPAVAVLEERQALYWFLAGYTAKVAGTERELGRRPEPTFSACFAAPFLPQPPRRYLELLSEALRRHRPLVVLMNTGAIGAPYEAGGERPPIAVSRAALRAAQSGALAGVPLRRHPELGILVPESCPDVPAEWLDPRAHWPGGPEAYRRAAAELAAAFHAQVNARHADTIPPEILEAGPPAPTS